MGSPSQPAELSRVTLPEGTAPDPVPLPHFPDALHAFVWRNWDLVSLERLAGVAGAQPEQILSLGRTMGLREPAPIPSNQFRRSCLTVIRRNWHLLPYEQLLELLGWTAGQLEFTLREDDFLFIKLGRLKPRCAPIRYAEPDAAATARAREIGKVLRAELPEHGIAPEEPLFAFVEQLSRPMESNPPPAAGGRFHPRFCYSYFALYGDPLLEPEADPYPEGLLQRLAACGVDGVWLQGVLQKLAPFPWDPSRSERYRERLDNLRRLVERAGRHGIGVYLYLNEPRHLPVGFFEGREELRGVIDGDHAALCTSAPEVQRYLIEAVELVSRAVPDLAGWFTITASENPTNCWSHGKGGGCPRCGARSPGEVVAEVNALVAEGIRRAGVGAQLLAWDWGWSNDWAEAAIRHLPTEATLMSVSEWDLPICRGGVPATVGEYSISAIGPGPRARRHWSAAGSRGLRTAAKIQAGNTWELSAVPYIPAVENVARHLSQLRDAGIDALMLGWTLGGYPSPNLEVAGEMSRDPKATPETVMERVACRRFGESAAPAVVQAWKICSAAFQEFPYHIGTVYRAPLQFGPSNLLWERPSGYASTMIGFPYDDMDAWRQVYPADVFAQQLERVAEGFEEAAQLVSGLPENGSPHERRELLRERGVMEAAALHFRSTANQARFVLARNELAASDTPAERPALLDRLEALLHQELDLARRLHALQRSDSRIGFEASNQYYYIPADLAEKILNCRDLLGRWLPHLRVTSA